jgi:threonine dehydratase
MNLPTLAEIESAAQTVYRAMPPTPQYRWPLLCEHLGTEVWLKHENHTPVGAFKLRGGLVYFSQLQKQPGVIAATRGNHGQSVAFCARQYGMSATIVVPHGNSGGKERRDAFVRRDVDRARARLPGRARARPVARRRTPASHGSVFQSPARRGGRERKPGALPRGARATNGVRPDRSRLGHLRAAAVRNALGSSAEIVGVVSAHAKAYALSFSSHKPMAAEVTTRLADGMAVRTPDAGALELIVKNVDRIVEVTDDEVAQAIAILFQCTHNCAEGAGAAAFAAMRKERSRLAGRKVAAVLSGGTSTAKCSPARLPAMNLDNLVAIDVHTHAWKSALQVDDAPNEAQAAMGRYFRYQPQHQTVPRWRTCTASSRWPFVVFTVDGEKSSSRKITNEEIAELAHQHADVAIPFASVNPHRGEEGVRLARS